MVFHGRRDQGRPRRLSRADLTPFPRTYPRAAHPSEDLDDRRRPMRIRLRPYLEMPDHAQIANGYLVIADALEKSSAFEGRRYLVKLNFLFNMMSVAGLSDIHNAGLIEINRCLGRALKEESDQNVNDFVQKIFRLLKKTASQNQYRSSIIDCITTLAKEVFESNNHPLVDTFIEELVAFGFQHPDVKGSTTEWQIQVNPAHIQEHPFLAGDYFPEAEMDKETSLGPDHQSETEGGFRSGYGSSPEGYLPAPEFRYPARLQPGEAASQNLPDLFHRDRRRRGAADDLHGGG